MNSLAALKSQNGFTVFAGYVFSVFIALGFLWFWRSVGIIVIGGIGLIPTARALISAEFLEKDIEFFAFEPPCLYVFR